MPRQAGHVGPMSISPTDAAAAAHTDDKPVQILATRADVLEAVRIIGGEANGSDFRPTAAHLLRIGRLLLGFDPATSVTVAGRAKDLSAESAMNRHLSVTRLRAVLDELVASGEIVKVADANFRSSRQEKDAARLVRFNYGTRSGYVTASALQQSQGRRLAQQRDKQRAEARKAAVSELLKRHADELEAAYAEICGQLGLSPEPETAAMS